jgi:hypothetical protein
MARREPAALRIFSGHRCDEFGIDKVAINTGHSGLWCPEIAQLRPQIVPWSTLCRADWVRNDLVLTMRGWLLRHYHPVSLGAARGHAIIDGPGQERAIAGRPTHDHWMNSPSSERIQPTIRL